MIKIGLINFLILFSVIAQTKEEPWFLSQDHGKRPAEVECEANARDFSNYIKIDRSCFFTFYTKANPILKVESIKKDRLILGYKNAIYTNTKKMEGEDFNIQRNVIAGEATTLLDIQSVDLSFDKKQIVVLDEGKAKIFFADRHGDITPHKVIEHELIKRASRLKFNSDGKSLLVVSMQEARVDVLPLSYDSRHPKQKALVITQWSLEGKEANLNKPSDVLEIKEQKKLYVLDQAANEIVVFNYFASSQPIAHITNIKFNYPFSMSYNKETDEFVVTNSDNSVVQFKLSEAQ